jgi:hypothetical protein
MPRLSLYRPEKGQDYKFIDRSISEMFQVGGTDLYLHKYLGPKNTLVEDATADQPHYDQVKPTNIQDLLFLENRDRKYDPSIYKIRGVYNVQNLDFNLSQFGLFIDNDTLFMSIHINDFIKHIGRKPISGDVLELPHLRDEFALGEYDVSLPRYYVVEDVARESSGFSMTWYPHLYRLKIKKIVDAQQFADILISPTDTDANFEGDFDPATTYKPGQIVRYQGALYTVVANSTGNTPPDSNYFTLYSGTTLQTILSTRAKELEINDAVLSQAEADAPLSGYETQQFYTLAVDDKGKPTLETVDNLTIDVSDNVSNPDASSIYGRPDREGYTGYLLGDGIPPNGYAFGHGIRFPTTPTKNDYFLRSDFMPNRLFRYDGARWVKFEDNVRMTMTNTDTRNTQKTGFINNAKSTVIAGDTIEERQALSKALKPRADF